MSGVPVPSSRAGVGKSPSCGEPEKLPEHRVKDKKGSPGPLWPEAPPASTGGLSTTHKKESILCTGKTHGLSLNIRF